MRFSVNNTRAVKVADESLFSRTLLIQNLDNWDVYFAPTPTAIEQLDQAGNPRDGFKLNGNPLPMILPDFYGQLWAFTTNGTAARVQVIEIETSSNKLLDAVKKIGKRFGLTLLLLMGLCLPLKAQWGVNPPDCIVTLTGSSAQRSFTFDNRLNACTTWQLVYTNDGFSAVSVELDEAPASSGAPGTWATWPAANIPSGSLPLTSTTSGQITAYKFFPFISIIINSTTGSGTVRAVAFGYTPRGTNIDINSIGTSTSGCQYNSSLPSLSSGQSNPVQCDSASRLLVGALATALPAGTNSIGTVQPGNTANTTPWLFNESQVGGSTIVLDPCQQATNTFGVISLTASGQIITGAASKQTYICFLQFQSWSTQNIAIVEGTGTVCATGIAGMEGGSTTGTGQTYQAGGSLNAGGNGFAALKTATAADNVCLLSSSTGQISGVVKYVQQ